MEENKIAFLRGIRDGIPICLGYLAVAFTLGIAAKNAGLTSLEATFMSFTNVTSAGEFAAIGLIAAKASYWEMAFTQLIINLRYCLMSCALSQKFAPATPFYHRLLVAFQVTDEIFGAAVSGKGQLNPFYVYGMGAVAIPGWTLGTYLGVVSGGVMPDRIMSAMSVALYGMFIAVIIPPAKYDRVLLGVIAVAMLASFVMTELPLFHLVSAGFRIILLTVLIAGAAAVLFPIKHEDEQRHE